MIIVTQVRRSNLYIEFGDTIKEGDGHLSRQVGIQKHIYRPNIPLSLIFDLNVDGGISFSL